MLHKPLNVHYKEDEELEKSPIELLAENGSHTTFRANSQCGELSLPQLAAQCLKEIDSYRRGIIVTDIYGLDLDTTLL